MKEITLKLTEKQLSALIDICDTISAMRSGGDDFTKEATKNLMLIDRMLNKNGYKRKYT